MSDLHNYTNLRLIKTFGRLKGRPLSKNQKLGLALHKQRYELSLELEKKIWLEVGFGNGHHLVELAKRNCDKNIVGSEVYENGVATTCFSLFQNKIQNAKVFHGDVRNVLNLFKNKTVDRFYILFPDPWTKKRHKSRRLLSSSNIGFLFKALKSKGYICIATDVEDYCIEIEDTFSNLAQFERIHVSPKEKNLNFFLDVKTKYEQKAISKGLSPSYLVYKKV